MLKINLENKRQFFFQRDEDLGEAMHNFNIHVLGKSRNSEVNLNV